MGPAGGAASLGFVGLLFLAAVYDSHLVGLVSLEHYATIISVLYRRNLELSFNFTESFSNLIKTYKKSSYRLKVEIILRGYGNTKFF